MVWGFLLLALGARRSLPVPVSPPLTTRSVRVAVLSILTFLLTFMPTPIEVEHIPIEEIRFSTPDGIPIDGEAVRSVYMGEGLPDDVEFESLESRR